MVDPDEKFVKAAEAAATAAVKALTPTALASVTIPQPSKPKMGGVEKNAEGKWSIWTGGKPKEDWTELDSSASSSFRSPNQCRPVYESYAQKGYNFRKTGLLTKFGGKDDLAFFKDAVMDHLRDTGMDTITYLADPVDTNEMVSVVTNHSCFDIESVRQQSIKYKALYDNHDRMNDDAAKLFLLDSLQKELAKSIKKKLKDDETFAVAWMLVLQVVETVSIEKYEELKSRIKARHPSQYSGENLAKLCEHFSDDAKLLIDAGMYDHTLTLNMIKIFSQAGGEGKLAEDFRYETRSLKKQVNDALLKIRFMNDQDADDYMTKNKLTFSDICEVVERNYRGFKDNNEWLPAKNVSDSKAPPAQYGANNAPVTRTEIMALMQSGFASNNRPCFNCGSKDHWKKDCPEEKKKFQGKGRQGGQGGRNSGGRNGQKPSGGSSSKNWRHVPPEPNEPKTKEVGGKKVYWCGVCKRWTYNHGTDQHVRRAQPGATQQPPPAQANLAFTEIEDPSAWVMNISDSNDVIQQLKMEVPLVIISMLLGGFLAAGGVDFVWSHLLGYGSQLLSFLFSIKAYPAPILWLLLLGITIRQGYIEPSIDPRSRRERRAESRYRRWHSRKRRKFASIADTSFHRRYPRRLRERAFYPRRPPRLDEQRVYRQRDHLHDATLRVMQSVRNRGRDPLTPTCRGGVNKRHTKAWAPSTNDCFGCRPCGMPRSPRRRPRARSSNRPRYSPVPSSSPKHGPGHGNWTQKQTQAARKIATQVNMMCFDGQTPTNPAILRMALQAPAPSFRKEVSKESTFKVIWDSGASLSVTPHRSDFVGPITSPPIGVKLKGLAKGLNIKGQGHVMYMVKDRTGMFRAIKLPAFLVPNCKPRLLSTTSFMDVYPNESITLEHRKILISGEPGIPNRGAIDGFIDPVNNLPTSNAYSYNGVEEPVKHWKAMIIKVSEENLNLTPAEKELLRWHYRLGHLGYRKIQALMRSGVLSHSHATRSLHASASKIQHPPKCAACQYGKQTRRPVPGKTSSVVQDRAGALKQENLFAGQKIAVDHFICLSHQRMIVYFQRKNQ